MSKTIEVFQVDAFTAEPFKGNPAAVCLLGAPLADDLMQKIAMEMNLSETAFLLREGEGFRLRWFTPAVEVDLCGHATLASAHVLYKKKVLDENKTVRFFTRSGELRARLAGGWIELDFPQRPVTPAAVPAEVTAALGVKPLFSGTSADNFFLEVQDEEAVRKMSPDFSALAGCTVHGVIVTGRSATAGFDFVSRFFAPAIGIDEDPVTGSAHCSLAPYWSRKLGKTEMAALQASKRGGELRIRLDGDRVRISGQAVTVLTGELSV